MISGTPEQVMQVLADRIGRLTARQEDLGYEVIAHKTALTFRGCTEITGRRRACSPLQHARISEENL